MRESRRGGGLLGRPSPRVSVPCPPQVPSTRCWRCGSRWPCVPPPRCASGCCCCSTSAGTQPPPRPRRSEPGRREDGSAGGRLRPFGAVGVVLAVAPFAVKQRDAAVWCPGCGAGGDRGTAITAVPAWHWAGDGSWGGGFGIKPLCFSCFASSVSAPLQVGCWSSAWG